jgi:serine/threonine-protein kinase
VVFIILEYLPNQTLEYYLRTRKSFSVQICVKIIQQLCAALDYAHQQGVIHFDLRPFHVKMLDGEVVKLAGFELARLNHFHQLSGSGVPALSPDYLSPEQIRDGEIDLRTDIFSLGVLFYQMMTGRKPFVGDLASSVIFHILEGNPMQPGAINAGIPAGLDQLILKMLAKEPGDRFFSTQEIAIQLKKYL